jgi:Pyridoxamine 5'-phosphate oxidase
MDATVPRTLPAVLNKQECEAVLERNGIGRLACYSPYVRECYVVPVAYAYHYGSLYLALVPGQKLTYLDQHPDGVCLEVEEVQDGGESWKTVVATGNFRRVATGDHPLIDAQRGPLRTAFDIGLAPYPADSQVLCRIDVRKLSGREDHWTPAAEFLTAARERA